MAKLPSPIELEISALAGIFGETGNPAAAWRCFALARDNSLPVPEDIDAEIVRFAQAVTAPLADKKGSITQKSVAAAWGITKGRKPAPELRVYRRDIDIYFDYWRLRCMSHRRSPTEYWIDTPGLPHGEAISKLVLRWNKSPKTIEEIMTRLFKEYGDGNPYENLTCGDP